MPYAIYTRNYMVTQKHLEITVFTHQCHGKIFSEQRKRIKRQSLAPHFIFIN